MNTEKTRRVGLILAVLLLLTGCSEANMDEKSAEENMQGPAPIVEEKPLPEPSDLEIKPEETPVAEKTPAAVETKPNQEKPANGRGKGGGGMSMAPDNDAAAVAILNECAPKFEQYTFVDPETGFELEYSLFVPENYSDNTQYPLIQFMPDSTGTGKSAKNLVENYLGAAVWVSAEDQEKRPCFVLVPAYTEAIADDGWLTSEQLETGVKLIYHLINEYNIDTSRIYTTGQSGGCMASLYLGTVEPELFAASLYVGGQWDINVLDYLTEHNFVYVTAGGDTKATGGQTEVIELFDKSGVKYSFGEWSAQLDSETQIANAQALLDEGCSANFIRFETGTVSPGSNGFAAEHMASFNFAYKLDSVRDWLFQQSK